MNSLVGDSSTSKTSVEYTQTITLSEPVKAKDAQPLAEGKRPAWKDSDWANVITNVIYSAGLFLGDPKSVSTQLAQVGASIQELEYRLAFKSQITGDPINVTMQTRSMIIDDKSTKDVDESLESERYSYDTFSIGSASRDDRLDCYASSEKSIPTGGVEANHIYTAACVSVNLAVADYRGGADKDEKNAGPNFVTDPDYSQDETPEYYRPEPAGPAIFLNGESPGSAFVGASFGGRHDSSEWTGTLQWSGGSVIVKRSGPNGLETVNSPIKLGKNADGERYVSGANLTVTAAEGSAPGTVNFSLSIQDSKGQTVGSDTAKVHLVNGTPSIEETGEPQGDFYTIPISDATGPAYRKVSLYGRPIPDAPPQAAPETDSAKEETYIDGFSLNLRHSTTDVYVPVPGSDLALTVRRNSEAEIWNFWGGLRPHERPDRPFGSGWSSNLTSSIEFMTPVGPDEDGFVAPPEATVTDDDGNRARFFLYDGYFFPYPSAPHEAKTYLSSLTLVEGKYIYKQKYGKTLEFEAVPGSQTIANDRVNGSGSGVTYSYARLLKVTDRLGYNLRYNYGGDATLIPCKVEAFNPGNNAIPGHCIYIRQDDATRCVSAVWDTSGNQINYSYGAYSFSNPKVLSGPVQKLNFLKKVSAPDTSPVEYGYEGESAGVPFVVEHDPVPRRKPGDAVNTYQLNVNSIQQKAGTGLIKYGFQYETDDSRQIYTRVPGFSGYVTQAGAPRRVKSVSLPIGGDVRFDSIGTVRIANDGDEPRLEGSRGISITDAEGNKTVYSFGGISIISLNKFKDLFQPEAEVKKPKMVYYTEMTIDSSPYGIETYSFEINAGLSLSKIVDFSGNKTTYQYNDTFTPSNSLFSQILPQGQGFFKFNDPNTVTKEGLPSKELTYSSNYRILSKSRDENGNATSYTVDSLGRRTQENRLNTSTSNGIVQQTDFAYDSTWKGFVTTQTVQALTDPSEAAAQDLVTEFVPDSAGRIASKTVQLGGGASLTTSYLYNWNNAKVFTTEPGGTISSPFPIRTLFTYDGRHRLKKVTFEDDSYKETSYDGRGRKIAERDENGNITSLAYDAGDRLISKIRRIPGGEDIIETFRYNRVGSVVESVNPRKFTTISKYDGIQRLTSIDEPGKGITQFFYDGQNSGSSVQSPSSFQPTRVIDPRGFVTNNFYDDYYRLTRMDRGYGAGTSITRFQYDKVGNKTHEYDAFGQLTQTYYDALDRPWRVSNALGRYEQMFYTSTGLQWKKRDLREKETITQYDGAGRPIKVIAPTVAAGTPIRLMEYDQAGNLSKLTDERGKITTYTYNARNKQITETKPLVYDAESGQSVAPVVTKAYDFVGNVVDVWDTRNVRTHMVYDAANRPTASHAAYQTGSQVSTYSFYDTSGNVTKVTDPRNIDTINTYDAANRLKTTTNGAGITTTFGYDAAGNRTVVSDGKGQTTTLQYDGLNRLLKTTDAAGRSESFAYDAINKRERMDSMGRKTSYSYDTLNRLKSVIYSGAPDDTVTYTYNGANQVLKVDQSDYERDVAYEYDELGRLTKETSNRAQHTYSYDLAGNRTGVSYGGTGRSLTVSFDDINRIQSIQDGTRLTEYTYTLNGSEASRTFKADGSTITTKITSTFDPLNRLDLRTGYQGGSQIYSYDPGYDANGNVTSIAETYASGLSNRNLSMVYDNANRLLTENITVGGVLTATNYEYDAADNCSEKSVTVGSNPTVTTTYTYNNLNQLTGAAFSDSTPAVTYGYDGNGNRTSRIQNANPTAYGYDYENRLTSVRLGGEAKTIDIFPVMGGGNGTPIQATYHLGSGALYEYSYDYRTRRVKRVEAGTETKIVFSGGTSVSEMTGAATLEAPTVEYVRGFDMGGGVGGMLYSLRSGTLSFDHYNGRGDVVAKTDDTGAFTYQAAYEARGKRTQEDGSTLDRQKANTKDEDPTGLLNEGFRYRDLETGMFLTRDPAGFVDGPNLYTYVKQNPWTKFDPVGLLETTITDAQAAQLSDSSGVINSRVNTVIQRAMSMSQRDLQSRGYKSAVDFVHKNLAGDSILNGNFTKIVQNIMKDNPKGYLPGNLKGSRYEGNVLRFQSGDAELIYNPLTLPVAVGFNINGQAVGSDKIDHMFSDGYDRFLQANSAETARKISEKNEAGENGYIGSGVYSNADIEADLVGFDFYSKLNEAIEMNESYQFDINSYDLSKLNENVNKNGYTDKVKPLVRANEEKHEENRSSR